MAIKLIAMDLDGTLLNSDKHVSERTLRALATAKDRGVYITIATGRMFGSAAYFGELIGANAGIICCNGGVVQRVGAAEPEFARTLAPETVARALRLCMAKNYYINWYIGDEILVEHYDDKYFYAYRTTKNLKYKVVGDKYLDYTEGVYQCVVRDLDGHIGEITSAIERECGRDNIIAQQNTGLSADLTPPDVNKALGLRYLAESLGLTPAEVMACGDADNDLAMLEYAGCAVVPANGLDCAKSLATYHTDTNDNDGIAKAIEELVLK